MSALAARALARPDSRTMALIGNGAQSDFQALAFHHLLGIDEIRLFDTDPRATDKLVANLRRQRHPAVALCQRGRGRARSRYSDHRDRRQDQRHHHHARTWSSRACIFNAVGGDCPGKTELHADVLAWRRRVRRIRAADPHRGRTAADAGRFRRDRAVAGAAGPSAWPHHARIRSRCSTRSGSRWRISRRCVTCATARSNWAWARTWR